MALNPVTRKALSQTLQLVLYQQTAASSAVASNVSRISIGTREVVGFGINGSHTYVDRVDFPMPAIRYKEFTPDLKALQEKERSDWSKLTIEEKKELYRASFGQTFSEIKAPTGEWKYVCGIALVAASLAVWVYLWMKVFVYYPMPDTLGPEKQAAQLKRMIDLRANPIEGIASKYDYEKGDWKK